MTDLLAAYAEFQAAESAAYAKRKVLTNVLLPIVRQMDTDDNWDLEEFYHDEEGDQWIVTVSYSLDRNITETFYIPDDLANDPNAVARLTAEREEKQAADLAKWQAQERARDEAELERLRLKLNK